VNYPLAAHLGRNREKFENDYATQRPTAYQITITMKASMAGVRVVVFCGLGAAASIMRVQLLLCGWLVGEYYTRRRLISDANPDLLRAASRGEDPWGRACLHRVDVGGAAPQADQGWQRLARTFFFFGLSRFQ
jgi:hypothetical protein